MNTVDITCMCIISLLKMFALLKYILMLSCIMYKEKTLTKIFMLTCITNWSLVECVVCSMIHDTSWCINKHCLYKYVMVYGIINMRKKVKSTWSMGNWKIAASVLLKLFIVSNERCHTNPSFSRMRWRLAWHTLWVSE